MKKILLTFSIAVFSLLLFGQNENPFSQFGYEAPVMKEKAKTIDTLSILIIPNSDTNNVISFLAIDTKYNNIQYYDKNCEVIKKDTLLSFIFARWLVPDPAGQYHSPYLGMGNNPVSGVDPDGAFFQEMKNYIFHGYWVSNDGWNAIQNGATYNGWTGNKLTGYASIGETVTINDAEFGTLKGVQVTAYSAVQDIPHFKFFNGPFIGNPNNRTIGVTDLFDGSSFTPNSRIVITGDKQFQLGHPDHYRHEFGHAIICGEKGLIKYYAQDAIPSVINFWAEGSFLEKYLGGPHDTFGPELDADRVGQNYFGKFGTPILNPNR